MPKHYGSEIGPYKQVEDPKISPLKQVSANIPLNRPSLKNEQQKVNKKGNVYFSKEIYVKLNIYLFSGYTTADSCAALQ